jgi:hypothetical protein
VVLLGRILGFGSARTHTSLAVGSHGARGSGAQAVRDAGGGGGGDSAHVGDVRARAAAHSEAYAEGDQQVAGPRCRGARGEDGGGGGGRCGG